MMNYSREQSLKAFNVSIEIDEIVVNTIMYDYDEDGVIDFAYNMLLVLYPESIHKITKDLITVREHHDFGSN